MNVLLEQRSKTTGYPSTDAIDYCFPCAVYRESVDDIYSDVYSEHFHVERALLPIFRVYKLKGVSKKLAVMLSAEKDDVNSARWNKLFDLCQEVRAESQLVATRNAIRLVCACVLDTEFRVRA